MEQTRSSADAAEAAVGRLRAAVDGLLDCELDGLAGPALAAVIAAIEVQLRRLSGVDARLLAAATERQLDGDYGATSGPALLVELLRITAGEARARLARAGQLGPRHTLTGAPVSVCRPGNQPPPPR